MRLVELEQALWSAVRARGGPPDGLSRTFTDGPRQSATERIGVYHVAYWHRQLSALASTFPRLKRSLGDALFERWMYRYIERRPSSHPCIERLGEGLPRFLAEGGALSPSLVGLAALEWETVACLLSPDSPGHVDASSAIGPSFASSRLELLRALLVVRVPRAAIVAFDERLQLDLSRSDASVVFSRPAFAVRHAVLDDDEATALALAKAGSTVAEVCDAFSGAHEAATQRALAVLGGWFRKAWIVGLRMDEVAASPTRLPSCS
jgi:Putative DNA-binding domain